MKGHPNAAPTGTANNNAYFLARIQALGITDAADASAHGISYDTSGNILQTVRTFSGVPILWQDKRGAAGHHLKLISNRKTYTDADGAEKYNRPLQIVRTNPANAAPGTPKYLFPAKALTGIGAKPMPTTRAIEAVNNGIQGGIGVGVEGYFKAVALAQNGIEATGFIGISTYRVCDDLADYLSARHLSDFVILYDGDARHLNDKGGDVVDCARVLDFYASAARFAKQFFEHTRRAKLKTRLHFAVVNETCGHKGVDDLFEHTNRAEVSAAFASLKTSRYFEFSRLKRTTFERVLQDFYGTRTHVQFYQRYGDAIGERPFKFGRATYQLRAGAPSGDLFARAPGAFFDLLDDTHAPAVDATQITVRRYLSEAQKQIDAILEANPKTSIAAPTGTGKTAFFLGGKDKRGKAVPGWFERTGTRGVIAVPTVNLAKQLAAKYNIPAFHGAVTFRQKEDTLNHAAIICTYDTLRHVPDLYRRALVVDEAHNLINQYGNIGQNVPFRADVLRRIVECFSVAPMVVLISGTPPRALAQHLHFSAIEVRRTENNKVRVRAIETDVPGTNALTAEALAQIRKMDIQDGRTRFVYFNSRRQLKVIADALQGMGVPADDIALLTRADVLSGAHPVYNGIVARERVEGVRWVLSTCLIAEGINIGNTDVGEVITVGIKCPDSFRQYVARFRSMPTVEVLNIRPPERNLKPEYFIPPAVELENCMGEAALQKRIIEAAIIQHGDDLDAIEPGLSALGIGDAYAYRAEVLRGVYKGADGLPCIDVLYPFARIRERVLNAGNNSAFYASIRAENIELTGTDDKDAEATRAAMCDVEVLAKSQKDAKADAVAVLVKDLQLMPAAVVGAYYARVKKAGNRHASARIQALAGDLLCAPDAAAQYIAHRGHLFAEKFFTDAIARYIRARFARGHIGDAVDAVKANPSAFGAAWARWKRGVEFTMYAGKRTRGMLAADHKAEIRFYLAAQKAILDAAGDGGRILLSDATAIIRERSKVPGGNIITPTTGEVRKMIFSLFDCSAKRAPGGDTAICIAVPGAVDISKFDISMLVNIF